MARKSRVGKFNITTTIELAVIGLATAIIYVLPSLALGITLRVAIA